MKVERKQTEITIHLTEEEATEIGSLVPDTYTCALEDDIRRALAKELDLVTDDDGDDEDWRDDEDDDDMED